MAKIKPSDFGKAFYVYGVRAINKINKQESESHFKLNKKCPRNGCPNYFKGRGRFCKPCRGDQIEDYGKKHKTFNKFI